MQSQSVAIRGSPLANASVVFLATAYAVSLTAASRSASSHEPTLRDD